jgi:hypothetical protein
MRLLVLLLAAAIVPANAASFSFTGSFTGGDDVQLFSFSLGTSSTVVMTTLSYAGGVNSAGDTIARGGFDPILTLFDSAGALLLPNDNGFPPDVGIDPLTNTAFDSYIELLLTPGSYILALTQYDNFAAGGLLSGGFTGTTVLGCSNGVFCDTLGKDRTPEWAVDIRNVDQARVGAVPEPSSIALLGAGLVLAAGRLRKRYSA